MSYSCVPMLCFKDPANQDSDETLDASLQLCKFLFIGIAYFAFVGSFLSGMIYMGNLGGFLQSLLKEYTFWYVVFCSVPYVVYGLSIFGKIFKKYLALRNIHKSITKGDMVYSLETMGVVLSRTTQSFDSLVAHWNHLYFGYLGGHTAIPEHLEGFGGRLSAIREKLEETVTFYKYKCSERDLPKLVESQSLEVLDVDSLQEMADAVRRYSDDTGTSSVAQLSRVAELAEVEDELAELHRQANVPFERRETTVAARLLQRTAAG